MLQKSLHHVRMFTRPRLPKRLPALLLLTVLLLSACREVPSPASSPPTAAASPTVSPTPLPPTGTPAPTPSPTEARPAVSRALILSIDGLRPDAIAAAPMPVLTHLMQTGAFTLAAQTTYPAATLPSHASMLTGLCPAQHGVDWNDYLPARGYALGTDLFDLAHAAGLRTIMVVGKEKLQQVTEPSSLDEFTFINDRDLVIAAYAAAQVIPQDFGVLFVHFPTADDMGDVYGWMSPEYLSVLRRADEALANLLAALDSAGLRADTLIIVTADHGGHEFGHYTHLPVDMTIPWIVNGPGVRPGELTDSVSVTDTAATAAWALGLPLPAEWAGLPVYEAFGLDSPPRLDPRCP